MASLNTAARELVLKIVYYGPGLGGKTTTLQALHDAAPAERRGKLVSLATPVDRTLYFDFLPLRLPPLRGLAVRLQLFTVPGQVYFNATRRLVLSGADGVVFVADSQGDRMDANQESLENLRENLAEHGRDLATLPHVFAYNKRDLADVLPLHELDRILNTHRAPHFGTAANRGDGAQATLDEITRNVLAAYEAQLPTPASRPPAVIADDAPPSVLVSSRELDEDVFTSVPRSSTASSTASSTGDDAPPSVQGTKLVDASKLEDEASSAPSSERMPSAPPAPRISTPPTLGVQGPSLSFAPLFAPNERALIEQIEQSIAHGDHSDALGMCDAALTRLLTSVAAIVGHDGTPPSAHDPALPLLLGLDGRRYLAFRAVARRARQIGDVGIRDALESYSFVLEARVALVQWDALRSNVGATSVPPPARTSAPPASVVPPLPRGSIPPPGLG